jgi:phosphatidate cytidylyltransferase
MLLPRILTGIVGGALLLAAIYFGSLPFLFVVLGIVMISVREFYSLARETGYPCYPAIGLAASAVIVMSVFLNGVSFGQATENQLTSALVALILVVIVCKSLTRGPADTSLSEWSVTFMGVFYVAWSLSHLLLIRDLRPGGRNITYMFFALIWAEDIMAYFIGSRWGRHKIAEAISPKKSWEGTIAGLAAAITVAVAFQATLFKHDLKVTEAAGLALLVGLLAFISDLSESVLKRGASAKDSSQILPGHGGVLDRFDSFLLTAPFYYYYWAFLKH